MSGPADALVGRTNELDRLVAALPRAGGGAGSNLTLVLMADEHEQPPFGLWIGSGRALGAPFPGADPTLTPTEHGHVRRIEAARAFLVDAVTDCWRTVAAGGVPSEHQDARAALSSMQAMRAGLDAVDVAFHFSGAGAAYLSSPTGRCFRDLHTAGLHLAYSEGRLATYAQARLGVEPPPLVPRVGG